MRPGMGVVFTQAWVLSLLILLLFINNNNNNDFLSVVAAGSCTFEQYQIVSVDSVRQCFNSIPLDPQVQSRTCQVLSNMVQLYSFTDIAMDSGPPFNQSVNLQAKVGELLAEQFSSDFEFHSAVSTMLSAELHDQNMMYMAPEPYTRFMSVMPFIFSTVLVAEVDPNNGDDHLEQYVYAKSVAITNATYSEWANMDLGQYVSRRVVRINGQDALSYIRVSLKQQHRLEPSSLYGIHCQYSSILFDYFSGSVIGHR
eukprot:GEZU01010589.1.p1 GENE.GEZU01010589.1~~GEZU01010589.1.p1  ORF type:complete len:255 (-),score=30.80 GEZU01010589.1:443-1207(-)